MEYMDDKLYNVCNIKIYKSNNHNWMIGLKI